MTPPSRGFTLIELVVTLTLVSVLAMVAVPLYEVTMTHVKESELRENLRLIRNALDAYKAASDSGIISKGIAESGFPPNLKTLVEGVDTIAAQVSGNSFSPSSFTGNSGSPGMNGPAGSTNSPSGAGASSIGQGAIGAQNASINAIPAHMVFLRQVPRDPFFLDQSVAPEQQWNIRAYAALPGDFSEGADVYDVSSKAAGTGLNGIPYKDW